MWIITNGRSAWKLEMNNRVTGNSRSPWTRSPPVSSVNSLCLAPTFTSRAYRLHLLRREQPSGHMIAFNALQLLQRANTLTFTSFLSHILTKITLSTCKRDVMKPHLRGGGGTGCPHDVYWKLWLKLIKTQGVAFRHVPTSTALYCSPDTKL
jgi:hypothetical protein